MKKIIVIGCPGSGKSHFSRALHTKKGIPLYHLDMLFWNADKTTVDRDVFITRLDDILIKDEWIIDGNFSSTMEKRMDACDTVFFLDYPLDICLDGVKQRRGKARDDILWLEYEEDIEFTEFIKSFRENSRSQIISLLEKYSCKNIIVFKSREEADEFLKVQ